MDSKSMRGIIGLVVVTLLSFGVILGTKAVTGGGEGGDTSDSAAVGRELDVKGTPGMERAVHLAEGGYETVVKTKGYGGDITMQVNFREDKKTLETVAVLEQSETEGLGARITEDDFLRQFSGMEAPVDFGGADGSDGNESGSGASNVGGGEASREEQRKSLDELENAKFSDGTYVAKGEPDDTGFTDVVSVTIEDGKITGVTWDGVTEDGQSKAKLSETGEYTMTEEGLTWKEQAEALAAALVENQALTALPMDDQGKTDAVAGVSISIGGFLNLAGECLREAAGMEEPDVTTDREEEKEEEQETGQPAEETTAQIGHWSEETTAQIGRRSEQETSAEVAGHASPMDGITGATISSGAVAEGINLAYEFLQEAVE
ncbi:FMN-binding protein [Blautia schinkii]|nr:FMN-binding protein [Blautia schinkii]